MVRDNNERFVGQSAARLILPWNSFFSELPLWHGWFSTGLQVIKWYLVCVNLQTSEYSAFCPSLSLLDLSSARFWRVVQTGWPSPKNSDNRKETFFYVIYLQAIRVLCYAWQSCLKLTPGKTPFESLLSGCMLPQVISLFDYCITATAVGQHLSIP